MTKNYKPGRKRVLDGRDEVGRVFMRRNRIIKAHLEVQDDHDDDDDDDDEYRIRKPQLILKSKSLYS
jgi:hypothetical protein